MWSIVHKQRVITLFPRQIFVGDNTRYAFLCRDAPNLCCACFTGHAQILGSNSGAKCSAILGIGHTEHRLLHHSQMCRIHIQRRTSAQGHWGIINALD